MSAPPPSPGAAYFPPAPPMPGIPPPPGYPMWAPAPPMPPGTQTLEAVRVLRRSIHWYLVTILIGLVASVFAAVFDGEVISGAGTGVSTGLGTSMAGRALLPESLAALALIALVGLVDFVLLIYSWWTWREGASLFARSAGEYGAAAADAGRRGRDAWTYTTVVFIIGVLATGVVATAIALNAILPALQGNATNATAVTAAVPVTEVALIGGGVGLAFALLYYWLSTGGLVGTLEALAPPGIIGQAHGARTTIMIGVALNALGLAGYFVPYGAFLGIFSPVAIFWGYWMLQSAYDEWLARPQVPGSVGAVRPVLGGARPPG